ncbi:MAG: C39 family peptidase, partial [Candidatus Thorarchaeota archaeon]
TLYFDYNWELAEYNRAILESDGIPFSFVYGNDGAFDLMRSSIDRGHPLVISVDPAFLPSDDYELLRELNATGGGHAVVIVGYDDVLGRVSVMDPGVGSFGETFGYPDDGRGNYTQVSYWDLRLAWSARNYISMTIEPGFQTGEVSTQLGPVVRDRLLGVASSYYAYGDAATIGRYGEQAFRSLGALFTEDGIRNFLDEFTGIDNETTFKTTLLLAIGIGMESQVTLQYLSYRTALEQLPTLMSDVDLTNFVTAGETALPHFEAVSDNSTLINPTNISTYTGPLSSLFISMSEMYNQTEDIDTVLSNYGTDLLDIHDHIVGIADSWLSAGNELAEIWPNDPLTVYGPIIIVASVGVLALITLVVFWIRKQPSQ